MKKFLSLLFYVICIGVYAQTYSPGNGIPLNNWLAPAQNITIDGRMMFWDAINVKLRPFNGTTEVLSYLNTSQSRFGNSIIVVDSGGVLQPDGSYLGGVNTFYMFKDGTANGNLVKMNLFGYGIGTCSGCLLASNNLSDLGSVSTALVNLNLNNVNNTSDATKWAAVATLTNKTIDGNNNTFLHIPNSALSNSTIGLTATSNAGSDISVTTTPAALGNSLVINLPNSGLSQRGPLTAFDYTRFNAKSDSATQSGDTLYNWFNGTRLFQSVIAGAGGVNSVNGTNASLLFSPTTGNVLGQVNPAFAFNWTGQHTFVSFAPIFSTLTTAGGVFYGNGSGQLLQSGAGTLGQILQSNGGAAPTFFTPNASTVNGWLGYTALSNSLGSAQVFVGNGTNIAVGVNLSQDVVINNTGAATVNGLKANALPPLSPGSLNWTGSSWALTPMATFADVAKNAINGDTLWQVLFGIPEPAAVGQPNGTPIKWIWLTSGGHGFASKYMDSCIFISSSGHLQAGFETVQQIGFGVLQLDEQTYPLHSQGIGNLDNFDFGVWIPNSGEGVNLVGHGSGGLWDQQSAGLNEFSFTIDTSTQGIVSFDLIDALGLYMGPTTNGTIVQYTGSNGYTLNRLWTGLTRNYRYQLLDHLGNPVIGSPQSTDRLTIFNGSTSFQAIDLRQYLSSTNYLFNQGLPNFWVACIVKVFPDSQRIIRPINFAAAPGTTGQINISWNSVSNAIGYQLDRCPAANFSGVNGPVVTLVNGTNVTSFTDNGLTSGNTYSYRLRAIRTGNTSSGQYSGWEERADIVVP